MCKINDGAFSALRLLSSSPFSSMPKTTRLATAQRERVVRSSLVDWFVAERRDDDERYGRRPIAHCLRFDRRNPFCHFIWPHGQSSGSGGLHQVSYGEKGRWFVSQQQHCYPWTRLFVSASSSPPQDTLNVEPNDSWTDSVVLNTFRPALRIVLERRQGAHFSIAVLVGWECSGSHILGG